MTDPTADVAADPAAGATLYQRVERFPVVGSTNDVVRGWLLDATPEVLVAVADEQIEGRGRHDRTWEAPAGAALLCSLGFRPTWLEPRRTWRLAASVALAMADAGEEVAGLPQGSIRLKWPNDLVIEASGPNAVLTGELTPDEAAARLAGPLVLRKLAGILGESEGLGTDNPRVVIGIGINADWRAVDFPDALATTMTSLREASGGRPVDRELLLTSFLEHLESRVEALRTGFFDLEVWTGRQAVTGRIVTLESPDGSADHPSLVLGVDTESGALVVEDAGEPSGERLVHAGEVVRVRVATATVPEDPAENRADEAAGASSATHAGAPDGTHPGTTTDFADRV